MLDLNKIIQDIAAKENPGPWRDDYRYPMETPTETRRMIGFDVDNLPPLPQRARPQQSRPQPINTPYEQMGPPRPYEQMGPPEPVGLTPQKAKSYADIAKQPLGIKKSDEDEFDSGFAIGLKQALASDRPPEPKPKQPLQYEQDKLDIPFQVNMQAPMALYDAWYGTNMARSYKQPMGKQERAIKEYSAGVDEKRYGHKDQRSIEDEMARREFQEKQAEIKKRLEMYKAISSRSKTNATNSLNQAKFDYLKKQDGINNAIKRDQLSSLDRYRKVRGPVENKLEESNLRIENKYNARSERALRSFTRRVKSLKKSGELPEQFSEYSNATDPGTFGMIFSERVRKRMKESGGTHLEESNNEIEELTEGLKKKQ